MVRSCPCGHHPTGGDARREGVAPVCRLRLTAASSGRGAGPATQSGRLLSCRRSRSEILTGRALVDWIGQRDVLLSAGHKPRSGFSGGYGAGGRAGAAKPACIPRAAANSCACVVELVPQHSCNAITSASASRSRWSRTGPRPARPQRPTLPSDTPRHPQNPRRRSSTREFTSPDDPSAAEPEENRGVERLQSALSEGPPGLLQYAERTA